MRVKRTVTDSNSNTTIISYKYDLRPSKAQHRRLSEICESQRLLYNLCLEQRINAWKNEKKSISCFDQFKLVTELRKQPEYSCIPANIQRATIKRLDEAFKGFFSRIKRGEKAGFPRFKGRDWWSSFGFSEFCGIRFDGKNILIKGLTGKLRVWIHRKMPEDAEILGCTFKRNHKRWTVSFQTRTAKVTLPKTDKTVGIDMGLETLAYLSDGTKVENVRPSRRAAHKLRRCQRALARCKKGSKRRAKVKSQVTKCHAKIANTRETYLHQVSAKLVRENDTIVIEDLNVKGMAAGMLAKSVNDASWGKLRQFLEYKAENAGKQLVAVDPRYTSQTCPECGTIKKKTLAQRKHECECGCSMNRDHAAAIVIKNRALMRPRLANAA